MNLFHFRLLAAALSVILRHTHSRHSEQLHTLLLREVIRLLPAAHLMLLGPYPVALTQEPVL